MPRIVFSIAFFRQKLPVQLVSTSTKSRWKFYTQVRRGSFHTAWVIICAALSARRRLPIYSDKQTFPESGGVSQRCQNRKWSVIRSRCVTPLIREGQSVATALSTHRDVPGGDRVIRTAITSLSAAQSTARRRRFSLPRQPKGHKIHLESRASGQCQLKCNLKGAPRQGTGQSGGSVLVRS